MKPIDLSKIHLESYEEAADFIGRIGILPLASFIPGHPSLSSLTTEEQCIQAPGRTHGSGEYVFLPTEQPPTGIL